MSYYQSRSVLRKLAHPIVLALWTTSAAAVGLGPIQLHSGLGQQLRANIPLLDFNANDIEPSCIKATVESADGAYVTTPQIGLISKGTAPAIVLSSKQAVMEPALTLRVILACGSLINREYQVLLDPPPYDIATSSERLPAPAASIKAEVLPAMEETLDVGTAAAPQSAAAPAPVRRSPPMAHAHHKIRKPLPAGPKKTAAAPPNTARPQRSVLKVTTADVAVAPIMKKDQVSTPPSAKNLIPEPASSALATGSPVQPDLQMYALQAQMKDQIQALQKEMAAMQQQNQLDKIKLDDLRKTGVTPQVMQGLIGLLLLCLGAIGWLGWRLYSLKNNHRLE
jgi:pilus assembly protein FimV